MTVIEIDAFYAIIRMAESIEERNKLLDKQNQLLEELVKALKNKEEKND